MKGAPGLDCSNRPGAGAMTGFHTFRAFDATSTDGGPIPGGGREVLGPGVRTGEIP